MTTIAFAEYQKEYEALGIGDLLYNSITKTATQLIPNYPANHYPPFYHNWDESAVREVAHDFIMSWLLETGRLEYYLLALDNVIAFEKAMQHELRRFMANTRRRSEFGNLFRRTKKALRENPEFQFFAKIDRNNEIWGLADWHNIPIAESQDEVLEVMWGIEIPPLIRYRLDSKKTSHLVSDKTLHLLLKETFDNLAKRIDLATLMSAMRYRLGLIEIVEKSFDDIVSERHEDISYADVIADSITPIEMRLAAEEAADDIYEMLTDRQRQILAHYLSLPSGTLEQVGESLNFSKSTIHNDLKAIERLISARVAENESEVAFNRLSELCQNNGIDDIRSMSGSVAGYEENQ
jgi:hypothetical protein